VLTDKDSDSATRCAEQDVMRGGGEELDAGKIRAGRNDDAG
jgi:hypothetical protein